jgi:hypothetical protein
MLVPIKILAKQLIRRCGYEIYPIVPLDFMIPENERNAKRWKRDTQTPYWTLFNVVIRRIPIKAFQLLTVRSIGRSIPFSFGKCAQNHNRYQGGSAAWLADTIRAYGFAFRIHSIGINQVTLQLPDVIFIGETPTFWSALSHQTSCVPRRDRCS